MDGTYTVSNDKIIVLSRDKTVALLNLEGKEYFTSKAPGMEYKDVYLGENSVFIASGSTKARYEQMGKHLKKPTLSHDCLRKPTLLYNNLILHIFISLFLNPLQKNLLRNAFSLCKNIPG